jgi:hypothetical protein
VHDEAARGHHRVHPVEGRGTAVQRSHGHAGVHHGGRIQVPSGVGQHHGLRAAHVHAQEVASCRLDHGRVGRADARKRVDAFHAAGRDETLEGRREVRVGLEGRCVARIRGAMQPHGVSVGHERRVIRDAGRGLGIEARAGGRVGIEPGHRADAAHGHGLPVAPARGAEHAHVHGRQQRQLGQGLADCEADHAASAARAA